MLFWSPCSADHSYQIVVALSTHVHYHPDSFPGWHLLFPTSLGKRELPDMHMLLLIQDTLGKRASYAFCQEEAEPLHTHVITIHIPNIETQRDNISWIYNKEYCILSEKAPFCYLGIKMPPSKGWYHFHLLFHECHLFVLFCRILYVRKTWQYRTKKTTEKNPRARNKQTIKTISFHKILICWQQYCGDNLLFWNSCGNGRNTVCIRSVQHFEPALACFPFYPSRVLISTLMY